MSRVTIDDLVRLRPDIWLETYGYIRDPGAKKVQPVLNILQNRMSAVYLSRKLAQEPMRGIVVKPRKRGASTMVGAQHYHQLQNWAHEGFIIGDKSDTSGTIFRMVAYYAETDTFRWGTKLKTNSTEKLEWEHGSMITQGTAQGKASARGKTPQFVHQTEKAHWEQPEQTEEAVKNAIPDQGFTVDWEESTPFGNENLFAQNWKNARWPTAEECHGGYLYWKQWENVCPDQPEYGRTKLDYIRIFAAWYEFDTPGAESFIRLTEDEKKHIQDTLDAESWYRGEADLLRKYGNEGPRGLRLGREVTICDAWEQLAWRRATIKNKCRSNLDTFNSEHPSDPHTCFVSSGRAVFDSDALDRIFLQTQAAQTEHAQIEIIERPSDRQASVLPSTSDMSTIQIFERPIVGCRYIMPIDLAAGKDQTKSTNKDPDKHSPLILRDAFIDVATGIRYPIKLAARVRPASELPIEPLARICAGLSLYYGNCMQIPEMNNTGLAYITAIRIQYPWVPLWKRAEVDPITGKTVKEMQGWQTTDVAGYGGVRTQIIMHLHEVIRNNGLDCPCPEVHRQLRAFVNKDGKMQAESGSHDDDVISLAIGVFNIRFATIYTLPQRQPFIPPDIARLLESEHSGGDMAMNW